MPSDRQTEIQAIRDALAARPDVGRTHWQGCATDPRHRDCALALVLGELSRVQQERDIYESAATKALAERDALTQEIATLRQQIAALATELEGVPMSVRALLQKGQ